MMLGVEGIGSVNIAQLGVLNKTCIACPLVMC